MSRARFIFFDMDGTLLDDEKNMDEAFLDYLKDLKKRKDVRFGISTGRHIAMVEPYIEKHGLQSYFDGLVYNGGADIYYFNSGEHIKNNYLSIQTLKLIQNTFQEQELFSIGFHNGLNLIVTRMDERFRNIRGKNIYNIIHYRDYPTFDEAPKLIIYFDSTNLEPVKKALEANPIHGMHWFVTEPNIIEMHNNKNTKAQGVEKYLARDGLTLEDIMVFGDADNDRHIMVGAGVSVCMKNGNEQIKKIADYVTEYTNNDNGIMKFLMKHEHLLHDAVRPINIFERNG